MATTRGGGVKRRTELHVKPSTKTTSNSFTSERTPPTTATTATINYFSKGTAAAKTTTAFPSNSRGLTSIPEGNLTANSNSHSTMTPRPKCNTTSLPIGSATPVPPGPSGMPFVGSLFQWTGPETNLTWTKRYGHVYRVKMGTKELVYLNHVALIERYMEGKHGESYLDRPMGPGAIGEGLLFGSGDLWKSNKRAFKKALYTVTFTAHMEESVQTEIQLAIERMRQNVDTSVKFGNFFLPACVNAIAGLLVGENLPATSDDRAELVAIAQCMEGVDLTSIFTQISLTHPKLRDPLSKLFHRDIVDVHGTSKRLQTLLRQWIRQATSGGPLSPTSPHTPSSSTSSACPRKENSKATAGIPDIHGCPFHNSKRLKTNGHENGASFSSSSSSTTTAAPTTTTTTATTATTTADLNLNSYPDPDPDTVDVAAALLVAPRGDESSIEKAMRSATNLFEFGFTDTGHGEQPFEEPEPPSEQGTPYTPITEQLWTFDRQMSMNLKKESTLQRILKQPEFADVTEGTDAELLQSLIDMFFGGVTSTLAGLEYIFVHLTRHQEFQAIARQEVDAQLTRHGGHVSWEMRGDFPYIQACITEALRLGCVTPSSLPHVATKDTEIEGYSIPKGTFVMASVYSIHHDPAHYLDPHEFRPHRHLDGKGAFTAPTSYKPYGVGARRCVGDTMAGMQLFIYTVYILRHFELEPVSAKNIPSLDTHMRIINRLKDFRCVLRKRDV